MAVKDEFNLENHDPDWKNHGRGQFTVQDENGQEKGDYETSAAPRPKPQRGVGKSALEERLPWSNLKGGR